MNIITKINKLQYIYSQFGLKPDVLVLGENEAEELRKACSDFMDYDVEDINGWEYNGLKVARINEDNYIGLSVGFDLEEK
jgi:hypothetical protein